MSDDKIFQLVFVLPMILILLFLGLRVTQMGMDGYFTDTDDYYKRHYPNYDPDDVYISESVDGDDGPFIGSKNSNIYHKPTCSCAENIYDENKIWFKNRADAEAYGYRPCKRCKP